MGIDELDQAAGEGRVCHDTLSKESNLKCADGCEFSAVAP